MKKLLFITHEVTKTGAPQVLLYFLIWLKENKPNYKVTLLSLKEGGGLDESFRKVVDSYYYLPKSKSLKFIHETRDRVFSKIGLSIVAPHEKLINYLIKENFNLIYANTVVSIPLALRIKDNKRNSKILAHVHELPIIININCPEFKSYVSNIDTFIAVSKLVQSELTSTYEIPDNKVVQIYEFSRIKKFTKKENFKNFTVGGAGTVHWRKGVDLFIQIAAYVKKNYNDCKINFIWIGKISNTEREIAEADIKKAGLEETVCFVGEMDHPEEIISNLDVFILSSREDPFPLVAIEAGMLGKPIICFKGATGIEEILMHGGGHVVPYMDIEEMAERLGFYFNNKEDLQKDGLKAQLLFSEFSPENQCPKIYKEIKRITNN